MSDFVVRWEEVIKESDRFKGMNTTMNDCDSRLKKVKSNLAEMRGFGNVTSTINTVINNVEEQAKVIKIIGQTLEAIALLYKLTEQKISGVSHDGKKINNSADCGANDSLFDWKDAWDFLSNAGVTGQYSAMLGGFFTQDWGQAIGKGLQGFGTLAENAFSDNPQNWKELLFGTGVDSAVSSGLDVVACGGTIKNGIVAAWSDVKDGYVISKGHTLGKNLSAGAQWAAAIIDNGFENYKEYEKGEITEERAVAETAIETAVDVGMGIGATVAVTAGAVALGVAAPAVVVGVVASGVVWGVNAVVKHLSGKDVGELAADAVCDGAEWVADKAGKALTSAKDAVCGWLGI